MRCQLSGGRRRLAYKAAAIHMCIHSIITTISCIIIRQIQVQRFFFSEGQVMKKSILRKCIFYRSSIRLQSWLKQKIFGKCQNIYCGQFEDL